MTNLISKHGGYKSLKSFQMAEIVFDLTFEFCKRYITDLKLRAQTQGAARGGKQNIAEGSVTSGTSKQSELRLVEVARASLEELKNDFEDFLRTRGLSIWDKNDPRALAVRQLAYKSNRTYRIYMTYMSQAEFAANCLLTLINQANYLLDQQLRALEKELARKGDFKERLKDYRKNEIMGADGDYDEFLKSQGLKRLANGQVVKDN